MESTDILNKYPIPSDAKDDIKKMQLTAVNVGNGVLRLMDGHADGVAFRFFVNTQKHKFLSDLSGSYTTHDEECVQFFTDKFNKPVIRLLDLCELKWVPELDESKKSDRFPKGTPMFGQPSHYFPNGKPLGEWVPVRVNGKLQGLPGKLQAAYENWKDGVKQPGTLLENWPEVGPPQKKVLYDMGIFSVEQFAEMKESDIQSLSQTLKDAFQAACQWVAAKEGRVASKEMAEEIHELRKSEAQKDKLLADLMSRLEVLESDGTENTNEGEENGSESEEQDESEG